MSHRICYYSPYGGAVDGIVQDPDPVREFAILQGTLRKYAVPDSHPLCQHIDDPKQPTTFAGWKCDGERLYFETPQAAPAQVGAGQVTAALAAAREAQAEAAAARAALAELNKKLDAVLAAASKKKGGD